MQMKKWLSVLMLIIAIYTVIPTGRTAALAANAAPAKEEAGPQLRWEKGEAGPHIVLLQTRLQALHYPAGTEGTFSDATETGVLLFQKHNKLPVTGIVGATTLQALFANPTPLPAAYREGYGEKRQGQLPAPAPVVVAAEAAPAAQVEKPAEEKKETKAKKTTSTKKSSSTKKATEAAKTPEPKKEEKTEPLPQAEGVQYGEYLDWFKEVNGLLKKGQTLTVTDLATGLSFKVTRMGGKSHADCEPLTKEDTAIYKRIYSGKWSWDRRPVIVTLPNGRAIAGSMNGMPHGFDDISGNGMTGHFCIHFKNSRTHASNKVCPLHQAAVRKAAGL